ncbi:hypothetical protein [Flectobacillus sp. BAB-3569]|uniref:hypothetical protein n=1 Tax=Flectobacillus sp. BAB-3569 TaxID=1509483 RepID=UPI000BA34579|nr:hypothetical protein [Flectobacillus sp. BAB-3569]PAC26605.1 hypothetical protein BWI92_25280 [Flectobacillus sp. BAB-3569]
MKILSQLELKQFKSHIITNLNKLVDDEEPQISLNPSDEIVFEKENSESELMTASFNSNEDSF